MHQTIGGSGKGLFKKRGLQNDPTLILRFCPMNEINKKRQRNIVEQSKFLAKLKFLRRNGKNRLLMEKL